VTCTDGLAQRNELVVGSLAEHGASLDGAACGSVTSQWSSLYSQITVMTELTNSGLCYVHHSKYTRIKTYN
jgi:hypothetical protein